MNSLSFYTELKPCFMPQPFTYYFCTLKQKLTMSFKYFNLLFLFWGSIILAQSTDQNTFEETVFQGPINDNSISGQKDFVQELMSLAGYAVDQIKSIKIYPITLRFLG